MNDEATSEANRVWARGFGVTLRHLDPAAFDAPEVQRALRDGIERNYEGALPPPPPGLRRYGIYAGRSLVGVIAFREDVPSPGAVVFDCLAIAPAYRGHAYAARALLAAERRLRAAACFGHVPRTNGRGLYFMLRCGYAPVTPPTEDGTTWFRRHRPARARRSAASMPVAAPARTPSAPG